MARKCNRPIPSREPEPSGDGTTLQANLPVQNSFPRVAVWLILPVLIVSLCFALYRPALNHGVVLDDRPYVFENPYLATSASFQYPLNLATFVLSARQLDVMPDVTLNFVTRPLTYATFYWNRHFSGNEPASYRLLNLAIHGANGVLVFWIGLLLGRNDQQRVFAWRRTAGPLLGALLFTAHPMATESVTYITQRFESLATLFCLMAFLVWHEHEQSTSAVVQWLRRTLTAGLVFGAMLSKETGVVAPVLILLGDWLVSGISLRAAVKRATPLLVLIPILPLLILAVSYIKQGMRFDAWQALNITNINEIPFTLTEYLRSQVCVVAEYLRLLVLPVGQCFDRDFQTVTSWTDVRLIASLTMLMLTFGGAWMAHRRLRHGEGGIVLFGVLWFFVSLLPSSSIVPLPDLFAEHRSYLPSVGLFLAAGALCGRIAAHLRSRRTVASLTTVAACWVALLCLATLWRNEALRDDETIYRDLVRQQPRYWRAWNGLGTALGRKGDNQGAAECFERAVETKSTSSIAAMNLTTVLTFLGRYDECLRHCEQALSGGQTSPRILHNKAVALFGLGRREESVGIFQAALAVSPFFRDSNLCLARIFTAGGDRGRALEHYSRALKTGPLDEIDTEAVKRLQGELIASNP